MQTIMATLHVSPLNDSEYSHRAFVAVTMPDGTFWRSISGARSERDLTDAQEARTFIEDYLLKEAPYLRGKLHGSSISYSFHTEDHTAAVFAFRLDCDNLERTPS
jgi:hypothetical protein